MSSRQAPTLIQAMSRTCDALGWRAVADQFEEAGEVAAAVLWRNRADVLETVTPTVEAVLRDAARGTGQVRWLTVRQGRIGLIFRCPNLDVRFSFRQRVDVVLGELPAGDFARACDATAVRSCVWHMQSFQRDEVARCKALWRLADRVLYADLEAQAAALLLAEAADR